jgi:hypothetical protein
MERARGSLDVSPTGSWEDDRKRPLSPEAVNLRAIVIDDAKALRLSRAHLESAITSETLSDKNMCVREGRRPNLFTYVDSMNGGRLSEDLAQRALSAPARPDSAASTPSRAAQTEESQAVTLFLQGAASELGRAPGCAAPNWSALARPHTARPGEPSGPPLHAWGPRWASPSGRARVSPRPDGARRARRRAQRALPSSAGQ